MKDSPTDGPRDHAVAYVRMCFEKGYSSPQKQMQLIREYARRQGLVIVCEYLDGAEDAKGFGVP